VHFDAIVLAGGRSRRLGGADKRTLQLGGLTLLELAVRAVAAADTVVAVGPADVPTSRPMRWVLEDPPFGGPAAALGAGLRALADSRHRLVVVAACDAPLIRPALDLLYEAAQRPGPDGWVAVGSDARPQPLLGIYVRSALAAGARGPLDGTSVHALVAGLRLEYVEVPDEATRDVDTWQDAAELGVGPASSPRPDVGTRRADST